MTDKPWVTNPPDSFNYSYTSYQYRDSVWIKVNMNNTNDLHEFLRWLGLIKVEIQGKDDVKFTVSGTYWRGLNEPLYPTWDSKTEEILDAPVAQTVEVFYNDQVPFFDDVKNNIGGGGGDGTTPEENKTPMTHKPPTLPAGQTLYARVRHRSAVTSSDWSIPHQYVVKD